jgi:tetratricopeptide (TPR) repeat protein
LLNCGYSKFKLCKYEESRKLFEEAVALDPRSAEAHAWLAAVYGRQIEDGWSMTSFFFLLLFRSALESVADSASGFYQHRCEAVGGFVFNRRLRQQAGTINSMKASV